jgi:hypothetical protein
MCEILNSSSHSILLLAFDDIKQDRQCTYECNVKAHSHNHHCYGKVINITYSECVSVALVT